MELPLDNRIAEPAESPAPERAKPARAFILALALGLLAALIAAVFLLQGAENAGGRLRINEVVSSNAVSWRDPALGSPDWIELYNDSAQPIELAGYTLARADQLGRLYRFSSGTIGPGECFLVYCGDVLGGTGFRLPKSGTTLVLASPAGSTLQELRVPPLETDLSYGALEEGGYAFFAKPTPGARNTGTHADALEALLGAAPMLRLTEVLPHAADGTGGWFEVYNAGETAIELAQYAVSDDPARPGKEKLPEQTLEPGAYAALYFRGGPEPGVGFGINRRETVLTLADARGEVFAALSWDAAVFAGVSVGADAEGNPLYYETPTPGAENGAPMAGEARFALAEGVSDVRISEILLDNAYSILDADGDRSPWVELYNAGSTPAELSAYALSDDADDAWKWPLPEGTLQPGEYRIVWLSGKDRAGEEWHTSFRLSENDAVLCLSDRRTGTVQTIPLPEEAGENIAYGVDEAGEWLHFAVPTPGAPNAAAGFQSLAAMPQGGASPLRINEVSAAKRAKSRETDWVELYNALDAPIDLTGWHLSDSGEELFREPLAGEIAPGGYHLCGESLSIASAGETLYLSDPSGAVVDSFDTGVLRASLSAGRAPDGVRRLYTKASPGEANDETATSAGYCAAPVFSHLGGYTEAPLQLALSSATEGAEIRYTLDGSAPGQNAPLYTEPIPIEGDCVVRARAYKEGLLESEEDAATFYFTAHDLPVVCLSMAESDLAYVFGSERRQDPRERAGYVEYYELGGKRGVAFPAGFRISGNGTRLFEQRSINLYLRGGYGRSSVVYPFFPGYAVQEFSSLSLRNSGQDWSRTRIRDAYFGMAVNGMEIENMQARFAAVYINGRYWGLYELKENQNEDQIAKKHGVDPEEVQMVRANTVVYNGVGNSRDIKSLFTLAHAGMSDARFSEEYLERVDEAYFTDYLIAQSYFGNADAFNQKYMRTIDGALKWRPLFYDLDWCMVHTNPKITVLRSVFFNAEGVETGLPDEFGVRNVMDMGLYCAFYENRAWRERFVERYAEVLNTTLRTDRLLALYDEMVEAVRSEMPRTIARWGKPGSMEQWEKNVEALRDCIAARRPHALAEFQSVFGVSEARMAELFPDG